MSSPAKEKLAKKLIAVLGKEDAIELIQYISDHPTDTKHKASDLCAILKTPSQKLIQDYLNNGIACLISLLGLKDCKEDNQIKFEVSQSPNIPEAYAQYDVAIVVPEETVLVAELVLNKIREKLRKIFRAESFPVKNASLAKVSIKVKSEE